MLGIGVSELVTILQLGFSGVAFLFLYMSYSLLSKEQQHEGEPRETMLKSIRSFSILTLIFAALVITSTVFDFVTKDKILPEQCEDAIQRASLLSENVDGHDINSMRDLLRNTIAQCEA